MSGLRRALRLTIRVSRRDKQQSFTVGTTVALAVCALVATGAVADSLLVRALPFPNAGQLVALFTLPPNAPQTSRNPLRSVDLMEFRDRLAPALELAGITVRESSIRLASEPLAARVGHASANLFDILKIQPLIGRTFTTHEDEARQSVAVLGYGMWQRSFGADPAVLGRSIVIDGEPFVVVGVMPQGFRTPFAESEFWIPLGLSRSNLPLPTATYIIGVGRLSGDVSVDVLNQRTAQAMQAVARERPRTHDGWTAGALSLREFQFGNQRQIVLVLFGASLVLCLVATLNVMNVTTAAVMSRSNDLRTAIAFGAGLKHLVLEQIVLTVSLVLVGSILGIALGHALLRVFISLNPESFQAAGPIDSWRASFLAVAIMAASGAAAGALAVRAALRGSSASSGTRMTTSKRDRRARRALAAAQVAAVMTLLAVAFSLGGALIRSLRAVPGFQPDNVLAVQLRMPAGMFQTAEQRAAALAMYLERVRALPGVMSASATTNAFLPGAAIQTLIQVEGRPLPGGQPIPVQVRYVAEGYFRTMGIPVRQGRPIDSVDVETAPPAAVVSESLARQLWDTADVIGKRLRRQQNQSQWFTTIGIAGDVSDVRVGQPPVGILYLPYAQINFEVAPVSVVVRARDDVSSVARSVRASILAVNPDQPVYRTALLNDFVSASLAPQWYRTAMLGVTATLGLLVAMVGVHGLVGRSIFERLKDIAIRRALGANSANICKVAIADGWSALVVGVALGIPVTLLGLSRLTAVVPEVQGTTLASLFASMLTVVLTVAAIAVTHLPRVLRVNTALTLRS